MKHISKKIGAAGLSCLLLATSAISTVTLANSQMPDDLLKRASLTLNEKKEQAASLSENSFIIKYKKPLTMAEHQALGGKVIRQIPSLQYTEVKVQNKKDLQVVMNKYQKNSKVSSISPSFIYRTTGTLSDPKANLQYQHEMLQTAKAFKLAGKNRVKVAVIDQGTDPSHPDLKNALLPGYNAANPANQPVIGFHGTHVSGIIGAQKDNGIGGYGINPNVSILPIDVFDGADGCTDVSIANGIMYAIENNVQVINMSLGGYGKSPILEEAINKAIDKGIIVVAAAGNEATDNVSYPAGYNGVLSVGSIDKYKQLASNSNYGPSVDLVAPGVDIYSTLYLPTKKSTFEYLSGTSMATPVVAGIVTMLLSKYPNLSPAQVEYILTRTADDLGAKGFDTKYANGLVNLMKTISYNIKNIPTYVKNNWTLEEIRLNAKIVDASKQVVEANSITKPFEQHWIQLDVKKGEYIQLNLQGAKQFDYKIMAHFMGANQKVESQEINQTQDGEKEAQLIKAPFDGTLAIGIKDVNNQYDESKDKNSTYKLTVDRVSQLPMDESSVEKMIPISSLPYQTSTPLYLAGEKNDNDYFVLTNKEAQLVNIKMSALYGLQPEISVYTMKNLLPENIPNGDKLQLLKEKLEGKEPVQGEYISRTNTDTGEEMLSFNAEANTEYIIKISSTKSIMDFWDMMNGSELTNEFASSLQPYTLQLKGTILPVDEDGISSEAINESNENYYKLLLDQARPLSLNTEMNGYIQTEQDMDYFLLSPSDTANYEISLNNEENIIPILEIYQLDVTKDEDNNDMYSTTYILDNLNYQASNALDSLITGLQKDKQYLVKLTTNSMFGSGILTSTPYKLQMKKHSDIKNYGYESSSLDKAVKLPGHKFSGDFALPNQMDVFYYEATQNGIKAISVESSNATLDQKNKYPDYLLSAYQPQILIIEDLNHNQKFDPTDPLISNFEGNQVASFASGSFKVQKGKSYLLVVYGAMHQFTNSSLIPYSLELVDMNRKDESTSQKPLPLKKGSGLLKSATGLFNAGIAGGDHDWFTFELSKNATGTIKLEAGKEIDGIINIYQNGKLLRNIDLHNQGDHEQINLQLKKGKYQLEILDANGHASLSPYNIKVYMQ